ncbi:MAG: nitroreductase family protein [Flavobacteriaceae bacterium]
MEIDRIINNRRAVYPNQFQVGDISENTIKLLLQNANMAPTHKMTQPWFFKVFKNKGKGVLAKEMVKAMKSSEEKGVNSSFKERKIIEKCEKTNCILGAFMTRTEAVSIPEWEEIAAVSMAVQNIWLSCVANNIGCYWSTPKFSFKMRDYFELKTNQRSMGFMYLGKFDHSLLEGKTRINIVEKTEWIL